MKRVQSANSHLRQADVLRAQHQHFASYLDSMSPANFLLLVEPVKPKEDVTVRLKHFRQRQKAVSGQNWTTVVKRPSSGSNSLKITHSKQVSLLQSARSIEALPPPNLQSPIATQNSATSRLFRGAKMEISPRKETLTNPLFRLAEVVYPANATALTAAQTSQDRSNHDKFLRSIHLLKSLVPELELTYNVLSDEQVEEETDFRSHLGAYYSLGEEMERACGVKVDDMLKEDRSLFAKKLSSYSTILRSVLRELKRKGSENEAIVVEMVWKLAVKLFDSALEIHDYTISDAVEMTKYRVKLEIEKRRSELEAAQFKWGEAEAKLQASLREAESSYTSLQAERLKLEQELADRQEELARLTDISVREPLVVEMQQLYRKMNSFLTDTELEQARQAAVLEGVEGIFKAAKVLTMPVTKAEKAVQTESPPEP